MAGQHTAGRQVAGQMGITVNGDAQVVPAGLSVAGLLQHLGLADRRLAVEVNQAIVPRSAHGSHLLAEGDAVELVQAIGGG